MQKLKDYLTIKGWKNDLQETVRDVNDISILIRRVIGLSRYGFKDEKEMTSREREDLLFRSTALWFDNEQEFLCYAMTNEYPLGRCTIGYGRKERRYDDSIFF